MKACRPRMQDLDAVLVFDLDDTLYLERDYVESGLRAVGVWASQQLAIPDLADPMLHLFRTGSRGHIFDEALALAGYRGKPDVISRMLSVYRQHSPRIALAEDAMRLLADRPPRTGFAIITDGYRDAQKRKLRALGLTDRRIDLAICTDRWGRAAWKPAHRAFNYVQDFFGLPSAAFCYVADNMDKDFQAPSALGWEVIAIDRPNRLTQQICGNGQIIRKIVTLDDLYHEWPAKNFHNLKARSVNIIHVNVPDRI